MTQNIPEQDQSISLSPFSLNDLWESILRHKYLVIISTLLFLVLGAIYIMRTAPVYEASAVLLLENQEKNLNIESVLRQTLIDNTFVSSEIQVLQSRKLVADTLHAMDGEKKKSSKEAPKQLTPEEREEKALRISNRISYTLAFLKVTEINKSRAISIKYQSEYPEYAANLVNTLIDQYVEAQLVNRYDTIQNTTDWLNKRVEELRKEVFETDTKVVEYRKREGLVATRGIDIIEQDISELSQKLVDAQANLIKAEARQSEKENYLFDTSSSVLSSSLIQNLRNDEAQARNELAELGQEYGPEHPRIIVAQAKLNSINKKIAQEIDKISSNINLDYQVAKDNVKRIEAELEKRKEEYSVYKTASVELQALEREAAANRELLEALNTRLKETQAQEDNDIQGPYTRILSTATVPQQPIKPNKKLIIIAAFIAGLGLSVALAIGLDQFQNGIYNGKQLQDLLRINNIALVPKVKLSPEKGITSLADYPVVEPYHVYTESIRAVSMHLRLHMTKDKNARVFNFTSSMGNEGKSNLIASLGRQMAMEGLKVLAIDCDIRRSKLGLVLGKNSEVGLGNVLKGTADLEEAILQDSKTNLHYICAGKMQDVNIISRQIDNWHKLVEEALQSYDVVLIDSPPILFVSDTKLIAKNCYNILCVRWKKTPINMIRFSLDNIRRLDCPVLGTVITLSESRSSYLYEYEYKDPEAA